MCVYVYTYTHISSYYYPFISLNTCGPPIPKGSLALQLTTEPGHSTHARITVGDGKFIPLGILCSGRVKILSFWVVIILKAAWRGAL